MVQGLIRLVVAFGVLVLGSHGAWAQEAPVPSEARPKIVVAVLGGSDVPEDVIRDLQDLFLTALAENSGYELIDRETLYANSSMQSDVDLLLCVSQAVCLRQKQAENGFEQYVLVKVSRTETALEFSVVTFNYTNDQPIDFANKQIAGINDVDGWIEKAFAAAERVTLIPVSTSQVVTHCEETGCEGNLECVNNQCVAEEQSGGDGLDWWLIGGGAGAGLGLALTITSIVFYFDATDKADAFADTYLKNSGAYVSDLTQKQAIARVDEINSAANTYQLTLGLGLVTLAAGSGVLAWRLFFADEPTEPVSLLPFLGPDGNGLSAAFEF